jgi:protein involved in polysaccharide export with SLBB domain
MSAKIVFEPHGFEPPDMRTRSSCSSPFAFWQRLLLSALAAAALAGCAAPGRAPLATASRSPTEARPKITQARIRPGLVVNVTVLVAGKKEIEEIGKRVPDSGALTLPLLGSLRVDDLALDTLSSQLTTAYQVYFVNPQVIVEFVRDDNREGLSPWGSVTVLGRVKKPGRISIPATRDLTLSGAIQQAGGFDTSAKDTAIRVTRRKPGGTVQTREINLRSVGAKGDVERDVVLQPDDVVFVPELIF